MAPPSLVFPDLVEGSYELFDKGQETVLLSAEIIGGQVIFLEWPNGSTGRLGRRTSPGVWGPGRLPRLRGAWRSSPGGAVGGRPDRPGNPLLPSSHGFSPPRARLFAALVTVCRPGSVAIPAVSGATTKHATSGAPDASRTVHRTTVQGTAGDDTIITKRRAQRVLALAGNDYVRLGSGDDLAYGDDGDD